MKIGIVQLDPVWEDKSSTKMVLRSLTYKSLQHNNVEWVIYPEMTLTGFSMNEKKTTLDEVDRRFFCEMAVEFRVYITYGGVIDNRNKSVTIAPDGCIINDYSKIHLFSYAQEHKYYQPGKDMYTFPIYGLHVTPAICYDLRFSNIFWTRAAKTDLYCIIANWPSTRTHQWRSLLVSRAIENQAYVIGVNRVGSDPGLSYDGNSLVVAPDGDIILDCGNKEGIFFAQLDINHVDRLRKSFPVLQDRVSL